MSRILSLIGLSLVTTLAGPSRAAEPVFPYQGSRAVVGVRHLIPVMKGGEGYGEKYTFDAEFPGRGKLYFSMTIANLGVGDHKMEVKGHLKLDGQEIGHKKELASDEWTYAKDKFEINAGPAFIGGTPDALVLKAKDEKGWWEATLTPIAKPWRPRNGQIQFGADKKASDYTVFPSFVASVKYSMDGGEPKTVEGRGYGSHSWTELGLYDQARWTLDVRGASGEYTFDMREMGTGGDFEQKRIPYLVITKGNKLLVESFDYEFNATEIFDDTGHENRYRVPESFTFTGRDASLENVQFRGKITKVNRYERRDMLKNVNAAVKFVAKQMAKPMAYGYDVKYLIEVKTGEQIDRFEGTARYHVYHFNP